MQTRIGITDSCWCCWCPKKKKEEEINQGMSNTLKKQLISVHDPFAGVAQPKIPDGKCTNSLGFSSQAVTEFRNALNQDTMHMLLFAGQNASLVVQHCEQNVPGGGAAIGTRNYYVLGFSDAGGCNWVGVPQNPPGDWTALLNSNEKYALHRVVSCGLQCKLLNTQDEDDGWFEAVRINEQLNPEDYKLTTINNSVSRTGGGCVAPVNLLNELTSREIVNDPSYATGTLRDLQSCQFNLHGRLDFHDFHNQMADVELTSADAVGALDATNIELASFAAGTDNAKNAINQWIDDSYDMIYLRLHCRTNADEFGNDNEGSRIHTNVVSNQEIYFETGERENRYHTTSYTIGSDAMSVHCQARRANQSAVVHL